MIEVNPVRSVKILETMKKDLSAFLNNPVVLHVYLNEYDWGEEDYDADQEKAIELLEKVDRRIKSLSKFEAKTAAIKKPSDA